jgi:hypothetical protein
MTTSKPDHPHRVTAVEMRSYLARIRELEQAIFAVAPGHPVLSRLTSDDTREVGRYPLADLDTETP